MAFIVSEEIPPPNPGKWGASYWERSSHPFNRSMLGWLAIDWAENPVGFAQDGFHFEDEELYAYHMLTGPAGYMVAVPFSERDYYDDKYRSFNKNS
jgi:hypothetical protein